MTSPRTLFAASLLTTTGLCFTTGHATGQSLYWNSASASATGSGGVYLPTPVNALDALSTNPAGLTEVRRPVANLSAAAVFSRGSFSNSVNSNAPLRTAPAVAPFGAFAMPLGRSRWTAGVAVVPDFAAVADWTYVDAPGTAGASYGLQRHRSSITAYRTTAGIGFAVNPRLSFGLAMGADRNTNSLHAPYIFQSQPVVKGLKTLLALDTEGVGVNGSAGLLARPSRTLQIGLSYRSATHIHSTGTATGNIGAQLAALGLGGARPDFAYRAAVSNTFPQSATVHGSWAVHPRWSVALQGEWVDWARAFHTLDVSLTNGNNADINALLQSSSLQDRVPLNWKEQFPVHIGVEHSLSEFVVARAGYAHANRAVPASTLTPLTAAIHGDAVSAGAGLHRGRFITDAAYTCIPSATTHVTHSGLATPQYDNSRTTVGLQTLTVSTTLVF